MKRRLTVAALSLSLLALAPAAHADYTSEADTLCNRDGVLGTRVGGGPQADETDQFYRLQYGSLSYEGQYKTDCRALVFIRKATPGEVKLDTVQYGLRTRAVVTVPEADFVGVVPFFTYESPVRTGAEVEQIVAEMEDGATPILANAYVPKGSGTFTEESAQAVGHPEWVNMAYTYEVLAGSDYYLELTGTSTVTNRVGPTEEEVQASRAKLDSVIQRINAKAAAAKAEVKESDASGEVKKARLAKIERARRAAIARARATYNDEVKPRYETVTEPYSSRLSKDWD